MPTPYLVHTPLTGVSKVSETVLNSQRISSILVLFRRISGPQLQGAQYYRVSVIDEPGSQNEKEQSLAETLP